MVPQGQGSGSCSLGAARVGMSLVRAAVVARTVSWWYCQLMRSPAVSPAAGPVIAW